MISKRFDSGTRTSTSSTSTFRLPWKHRSGPQHLPPDPFVSSSHPSRLSTIFPLRRSRLHVWLEPSSPAFHFFRPGSGPMSSDWLGGVCDAVWSCPVTSTGAEQRACAGPDHIPKVTPKRVAKKQFTGKIHSSLSTVKQRRLITGHTR